MPEGLAESPSVRLCLYRRMITDESPFSGSRRAASERDFYVQYRNVLVTVLVQILL